MRVVVVLGAECGGPPVDDRERGCRGLGRRRGRAVGMAEQGHLAVIPVGAPLVLVLSGLIAVGAGLVLEASPLLNRMVAGT